MSTLGALGAGGGSPAALKSDGRRTLSCVPLSVVGVVAGGWGTVVGADTGTKDGGTRQTEKEGERMTFQYCQGDGTRRIEYQARRASAVMQRETKISRCSKRQKYLLSGDSTPERDAIQFGGRGRLVDRAKFDECKLLFIVQVDGQHRVARLEV